MKVVFFKKKNFKKEKFVFEVISLVNKLIKVNVKVKQSHYRPGEPLRVPAG